MVVICNLSCQFLVLCLHIKTVIFVFLVDVLIGISILVIAFGGLQGPQLRLADYVMLRVTYGVEALSFGKWEQQKLLSSETVCDRRVIRIPWTVRRRNEDILEEAVEESYTEFGCS